MDVALDNLRPFTDADYERFVAFRNRLSPESPRSVDELRYFEAKRGPDEAWGRFLLEHRGTLIAATSYARDMNVLSKQVFGVTLLLEPEHLDLSEALYEHLLSVLEAHHPVGLRTQVREDWPHWPAFYKEHGFEEFERRWASTLHLADFQPEKFAWATARAEAAGITFKTLADLPDDETTQRLIYNVVIELLGDVPFGEPLEVWPFEKWCERWWGNPTFRPASYFMAFDGDELVGVSDLFAAESADKMHTGLTGVRGAWRRKGVAQALKLEAAEYAREHGVTTIDTQNHSTNRPMLAINEAMGFVKQPALLFLKKDVERTP
ncbi:GNAT family N-acetyltransferase [soil metagenome]